MFLYGHACRSGLQSPVSVVRSSVVFSEWSCMHVMFTVTCSSCVVVECIVIS